MAQGSRISVATLPRPDFLPSSNSSFQVLRVVLWAGVRRQRPTAMAGQNRSKNAVHRTRFAVGERLLRELQLQAQERVPQRRDLLLDQRAARAGRALARPLQLRQTTLVARL